MNIKVNHQHLLDEPFRCEYKGSDCHIIEGAKPRTTVTSRMVATAGSVAGQACFKRQPSGQNGSSRCQPCSHAHALSDVKADFALDLSWHIQRNYLIDIGRCVGQ